MNPNALTLPPMKAEAASQTATRRIDMQAELANYRDALLSS
jgi:hypothetical protein